MKLNAVLVAVGFIVCAPASATGLATCDSGPKETWQPVEKLEKMLVEKGWKLAKDVLYMEADHGMHSEAAWAARVEPALRFLFAGS